MTDTKAHPDATRRRLRVPVDIIVAAAALTMVVAALTPYLEDPPRAAFTVRNDTAWDIAVYVQSGSDSVMSVTTVEAEQTVEVREMIVPGDTWRFIWRFGGEDIDISTVRHDTLVRPGFELRVPDEVEATLRARGAPPSP